LRHSQIETFHQQHFKALSVPCWYKARKTW
jgi:shikimate 5-dehydrogenase